MRHTTAAAMIAAAIMSLDVVGDGEAVAEGVDMVTRVFTVERRAVTESCVDEEDEDVVFGADWDELNPHNSELDGVGIHDHSVVASRLALAMTVASPVVPDGSSSEEVGDDSSSVQASEPVGMGSGSAPLWLSVSPARSFRRTLSQSWTC